MDNETLQAVIKEIEPILRNRRMGKIFELRSHELVIDFRPGDGLYLLLNFELSRVPRLYFVRRRVRDLEKQSQNPSNFVLFVHKRLAHAQISKITQEARDRIVRFAFLVEDEASDEIQKFALVAQLTGRTANLFLLDANDTILNSLRAAKGQGQEIGQTYAAPVRPENSINNSQKGTLLKEIEIIEVPASDREFSLVAPLSEKLDVYFSKLEAERDFETVVQTTRSKLRQELNKKEKLWQRFKDDLTRHGNAEELKQLGDLLLANLATARREGDKVFVTNFFDENAAEIAIEVDLNLSLPEAAEKFFARYSKARNASQELSDRIEHLTAEIEDLKLKQAAFEEIARQNNLQALIEFNSQNNLTKTAAKIDFGKKDKKAVEMTSGVRRYRSSDNYEILVGRNSKDNDHLTTRVARSLDWWFHAADYPGSHVVVRNPQRVEQLPPKTLLEAAQLAAKFSHAKDDAKVAVNYTQRKFVSKPKNAAPGLVRLASFRTILVAPLEAGERLL